MKIKNLLAIAAFASVSLLFTACPGPNEGPNPPEKEKAHYDEVQLLGNCKNSDYSADAYTFGGKVPLGGATKLTANSLATLGAGSKIAGVRVRIDDEVDDFKVFVGADYENPDYVQNATYKAGGWQYVLFDKPYEFDGSDIYIGWSGMTASLVIEEQESAVPGEMAKMEDTWVTMAEFCKTVGLKNNKIAWPLQAICAEGDYSNENIQNDIVVDYATFFAYAVKGEKQRIGVELRNNGIKTAKNLKVRTTIGGDVQESKLNCELMNGQTKTVYFDAMQKDAADATQSVLVEVVLDGDQDFDNNSATKSGQRVYSQRDYNRNVVLVEQFTGQNCQFCPMGAAVLKEAIEGLDDKANRVAWVANHYGFGTDDLTVSESSIIGQKLRVQSAPACSVNRMVQDYGDKGPALVFHPSATSTEFFTGLLDEPALAGLEIASEYDADTRELTVTVSGETKETELYLTAIISQNGIVARQSQYGSGTVKDYVHNHAPRKFLSAGIGDKLDIEGGKYTKTYTIKVPEKVGNFNCVPEDMELVAFVHGDISSKSNCAVYNADWVDLSTGKRQNHPSDAVQETMMLAPVVRK